MIQIIYFTVWHYLNSARVEHVDLILKHVIWAASMNQIGLMMPISFVLPALGMFNIPHPMVTTVPITR